MPMVQALSPLPVVNPRAGVVDLKRVKRLLGVVVPMPTRPEEFIYNFEFAPPSTTEKVEPIISAGIAAPAVSFNADN